MSLHRRKETNDTVKEQILITKIKIMANKNFNAKKVLMSTLAAVAFSFVFTTNADAIRVKVRVKAPQSQTVIKEKKQQDQQKQQQQQQQQQQQKKEDCNEFILLLKQMFGVRV